MEQHAAVKIAKHMMAAHIRERGLKTENTTDSSLLSALEACRSDLGVPAPIRHFVDDNREDQHYSPLIQRVDQDSSNHYRSWYNLIETKTSRDSTCNIEKLSALSDEAQTFAASVTHDTYAAGLWQGDLAIGLLWHDTEFERLEGAASASSEAKPLQRPASNTRAPSWTWSALDGSIRFLQPEAYDVKYVIPSKPPLVQDVYAYTLPYPVVEPFGSILMQYGCVSLRGQMRELNGIRGFSEAFVNWMRDNRPYLGYDCTPDISTDPDFEFDCSKFVLPLCRKRCHPRCRHATGCDKDMMAYGLVLHFVGQGPQFDDFPALRLARLRGSGQVKPNVEVFMRCGVVAFYMSSFKNAPWQDAVIV